MALALLVLNQAIYIHVSTPFNALTLNAEVGFKPPLNKVAFCRDLNGMNCTTSAVGDAGRSLFSYAGAHKVRFTNV